MTTIDPTTDAATAASGDGALARLLAAEADWLTSTDHKKIGQSFIGAGVLGLLATIVTSVLLGVERADIVNVDDDALAQLLDAQRVGLVFGALLPISLGLCIAIVPLQLGARSLAFPRLAASGFWMWLVGLVFAVIALANNGGGLGGNRDMVDLFIGAHGLMAIGLAAAAGSIATSVLTTRAPGMTMRRVPFFAMSALITALGLLLAMPVLLGTLTYLFLDHRNALDGFGGNVGVYQWAGWVFTQPTTFLFAIPALGVLAEGAPLMWRQRTPARGLVFAGFALIGTAAFTAVSQQNINDVPWAGSDFYLGDREDIREKLYDVVPWALFNLLPVLGLVIVLLMSLFLAKPVKGSKPNVTAAFAFGFLGTGMIMVAMLGNALFAINDLGLQDAVAADGGNVFAEAVLVYVVYGTVLAVMGGLAHWAPKLWGRQLPSAKVLPLAGLAVVATVLASFPNYIAGFDEQRTAYTVVVLVGHLLMALTLVAFIGLVATTPADSSDDPHGGQTLEWATTSPAPTHNFVEPPTVMSAEPMIDMNPNYADTGTEGDA